MKLIDSYIIKRYLGDFFVMILLFIPIGIMVDLAEKLTKWKKRKFLCQLHSIIILISLGILRIFFSYFFISLCYMVYFKISK